MLTRHSIANNVETAGNTISKYTEITALAINIKTFPLYVSLYCLLD